MRMRRLKYQRLQSDLPIRAVIKIGHGCEGSATTAVRVTIPEGIIAVKPMPKPGWTLSSAKQRYSRSYEFFHGTKLGEGVTEIIWSRGSLPDEHYDEFVFSSFVAKELEPGISLYFPVVQTCENGEHRWIEVPSGERDLQSLRAPAPALKLGAPRHSHH